MCFFKIVTNSESRRNNRANVPKVLRSILSYSLTNSSACVLNIRIGVLPLLRLPYWYAVFSHHLFPFPNVTLKLILVPEIKEKFYLATSPQIRVTAEAAQLIQWINYRLRNREIVVRFPKGATVFFIFFKTSRPPLGPSQPPIQWLPSSPSPEINRPGTKLTTYLYLHLVTNDWS